MSLFAQFLLAARPRGLEKLQLKPKMLGLLTALVEIPHARVFRRQRERARTCPVYTPKTTLHSGPTVALNLLIRKSRERASGCFFHRGERPVLVEHAAGHFLPICSGAPRWCGLLFAPRCLSAFSIWRLTLRVIPSLTGSFGFS